ncbi:WAS/WASL-interacting protein family member 3-like [Triticum urartu]|uniref:WAS/WASL-interacting protein family member 3-like n=1 Tax=Triticum urartu TaxID=4572 RepID=UPI0020447094|nr:WAS/WASL-interacting protein family member 3-like [Triticum urartu]
MLEPGGCGAVADDEGRAPLVEDAAIEVDCLYIGSDWLFSNRCKRKKNHPTPSSSHIPAFFPGARVPCPIQPASPASPSFFPDAVPNTGRTGRIGRSSRRRSPQIGPPPPSPGHAATAALPRSPHNRLRTPRSHRYRRSLPKLRRHRHLVLHPFYYAPAPRPLTATRIHPPLPPRPSFSVVVAFLLSHRRRESCARHPALPPSSSRPASRLWRHCAEQCHHAQPRITVAPSSSMMLLPSSSMLLPPLIQPHAPGSLRIELPRAHKLFVYIPQTKSRARYDATWEIVTHLRFVPPQDPVRLLSSAFLYAQLCVLPRQLPLLLLGTETFHEIPQHLYVIFRDVP